MEAVRDGHRTDAPSVLRDRDLSRALYGSLKDQLGQLGTAENYGGSVVRENSPAYGGNSSRNPVEELLASAACQIEDIIRRHAVVRWRENPDAQNRMRNDLDDFLFALQDEKGIKLSLPQMDAIIGCNGARTGLPPTLQSQDARNYRSAGRRDAPLSWKAVPPQSEPGCTYRCEARRKFLSRRYSARERI